MHAKMISVHDFTRINPNSHTHKGGKESGEVKGSMEEYEGRRGVLVASYDLQGNSGRILPPLTKGKLVDV